MHEGCGESYEFSAVAEVLQQKGGGAWQFWCMAALLELVHGSHPHLHFHLLHLARLLCRPTQLNLKLHPNASPIELLSTAVLLHLVRSGTQILA